VGGSRIEVGSDVAGSLRLPAAFCGVYALKGSVGRFPAADNESTMPGLLSLPTVAGPIAPSLDDLSVFYQRVIEMCPWTYDPSVSSFMQNEISRHLLKPIVFAYSLETLSKRKKIQVGHDQGK